MAFKFITVSLIITYLTLSGCTHLRYEKSQKAQLSISIIEQDRIRFSGKGAGAGMMMSSSMGAMGIAIGVAIDEGIGKDIDAALRKKCQIYLIDT